jgi:hypothetical protein
LQEIKDSKDYRRKKLMELREAIKREPKLFQEISEPIHESVH